MKDFEVTVDISLAVKIKVKSDNIDEAMNKAVEKIRSLGAISYQDIFYIEAEEI